MKVYYEFEGIEHDSDFFTDFGNKMMETTMEKWKYKTMWALRSIEAEINEEGGMIILTIKGMHTKQFSRELTDKIAELIRIEDAKK